MYRGGSQTLFCLIINEFKTRNIGIPSEDYSPFVGISRDNPSSKTEWYKIHQYDSQSQKISGNYLKGSGPLDVSKSNIPSTYPSNNIAYSENFNLIKNDPGHVFPLKSINEYIFNITGGGIEGYTDYTKEIVNIDYGRIDRYLLNSENINFQKIAEDIMKYIFLFGPINVSIQSHNIEVQTIKIEDEQYYSYKEFNKDALNWQKGILSDEEFNKKYDNTTTNHAVYFLGWKTDILTGKKLWIIKNSWGTGWGDNGYVYVPMGINASAIEIHPDFMIHKDLLTPYFIEDEDEDEEKDMVV